MAVDHHRAGIEEQQVAALIAAADALADGQDGMPNGFVGALFDRVVPEDLLRYQADDVAAFAKGSWAALAQRKPGTPKMRLEAAGAGLGSVSVLEIINDDMPFLVDSV